MAIVAMGTAKLYSMGVPTAIIFAIGSALIFIFYGYRWFGTDLKNKSSTWPPTINTCPDYLTYIKSLPGDNNPGCVDMLGVSRLGFAKTIQSDLSVTGTNGLKIGHAKVFPFISKDVLNATSSGIVQSICDQCRSKGLTWEGVFDGDNCVGIANNTATQSASASGSGSCTP